MKDKILSLAVKGKITGEDIERLYYSNMELND